MEKSALELLLDDDYNGTVFIKDENNKDIEYVQMALIPFDNNMYAIVVEKQAFESGDIESSGIVLGLDEEKNEIRFVDDENTINYVFEAYDMLFEEQMV